MEGQITVDVSLMTVKQAVAELGVDVKTIYRNARRGKLRTVKVGPHALLLNAQDVERFGAERQRAEKTVVTTG